MGPIALFDKSFLQSLTVDESVWFDHFFLPVICPVFFVETLADLTKVQRPGSPRSPQDEVRILADKTPVMSGAPCVHHMHICIANLMGQAAPRVGQVPRGGGRPVRSNDGKPGIVFEKSQEEEAFARWQRERFDEVEREMASAWRQMLSNLNLPQIAKSMRALGFTPQNCKTVEEAYGLVQSLVHSQAEPREQINLLFAFVDIPIHLHGPIYSRWESAGFPPLAQYAPYAAHVLAIELFFQIALAANLISADRASNRADIAYLFYLPFVHIFVSSDKLHRRCAPVFLKSNQDFIWGQDLKAALADINQALSSTTENERQKGLFKLASSPPGDKSNLVVAMWDKHAPRYGKDSDIELPLSPEANQKVLAQLKSFTEAPTAPEVASVHADDLESVAIERLVPAKRGSWWIIPKSVADKEPPHVD